MDGVFPWANHIIRHDEDKAKDLLYAIRIRLDVLIDRDLRVDLGCGKIGVDMDFV